VAVIIQDNATSWSEKLKNDRIGDMPVRLLDEMHGLYIEDSKGNKYGKKRFKTDTKTYIPFMWYDGSTRGVGVHPNIDYGNGLYSWQFHIPLKQIPPSAGRLILKGVIHQINGSRESSLPIAITVRE
jgi:hypothetical protein